jgi:hypothetical protein
LHTSRINFTLGYETLLSKYKVSPKMDFWQLWIFWTIVGGLICFVVVVVYWKVDFK